MERREKYLQCIDCGKNFPFTVKEQELYISKGLTCDPKRCLDCRQKRKATLTASPSGTREPFPHQFYPTICAQCGKETEVPFRPRAGRPIYCPECYKKLKS